MAKSINKNQFNNNNNSKNNSNSDLAKVFEDDFDKMETAPLLTVGLVSKDNYYSKPNGLDDDDIVGNNDEKTTKTSTDSNNGTRSSIKNTPLFRLTVLVWVATISFGLFALFQYVLPAIMTRSSSYRLRWEKTDPGLYREGDKSSANLLMIVHIMFGIFLMFAGPVQLIPWMRTPKYIKYHRWIGRCYLLAASVASSCVTIFVLAFGTSRKWIHEDIQNTLVGLAVLTCSIQSYRYIAIKSQKNIQLHKLWSLRLFGVILGAIPLYRICSWPIYILGEKVLPPIEGINPHPIISVSFYFAFTPWIIIELMYRNKWKTKLSDMALNLSFGVLLALFLPVLVLTWTPAIFDLSTHKATTEMKINT